MKHFTFLSTLLFLAVLSTPALAQQEIIDEIRHAYPDDIQYAHFGGSILEDKANGLELFKGSLIPKDAKPKEVTTLMLNSKVSSDTFSQRIATLTEKEGYNVDMAVQMKGKNIFIFSKTEELKGTSDYRYLTNCIAYNQSGDKSQFIWCVFVSSHNPQDEEAETQSEK